MKIYDDLLSLFFPRTCEACLGSMVKEEEIICTSCMHDLPRTGSHFQNIKGLDAKFYGKTEVEYIWSFLYFKKNSPVQKLLHSLKYENKPEIGYFLGKLFATEVKKELPNLISFDSILPVPLHPTRQKRRGYNQSEHFALGLGETLGISVDEKSLIRTRKSETQTRKSRMERWQNVSEIFNVPLPGQIDGKSLLLVDDVMTTGSTLEACVYTLKEWGAKKISVATIAVAI